MAIWQDTSGALWDDMNGECLNIPGWKTGKTELTAAQAQALQYPAPTLPQVQASQSTLMAASCQSAIEAGFGSSALGTANTYGCKATDQANINLAAISGGNLWCADSAGAWAFTAHTAAQAQQVQKDMVTHIQAQQTTYAKALSDIAAATTVSGVLAITWTNP
ncbi:MAG: DUF4376 domain-containing protein [Acidobacteriaceae bacterium]